MLQQFANVAEVFRGRKIFVVDDQFAQDREETLRFCKMLEDYQRRMKVRFFVFVQVRLEVARDEELLRAMRAAGIRVLAIGTKNTQQKDLAYLESIA